MEANPWEPLSYDEDTAWLGADGATGFDPDGWEASIWMAHSIFELPGVDVSYTHDDAHKADIAAGVSEPLIVGSINLDDVSIVTGGGLGYAERPPQEWVRIRWSELAVRLGVSLRAKSSRRVSSGSLI